MAGTFSFDVNCPELKISANSGRNVTVTLDDVEKKDILDLFDIQEFIDHFGEDNVIDQLGNRKLEAWAESNGYTKE